MPELRRFERLKRALAAAAALVLVSALAAWKGDKVVDKVVDLRFGSVLAPAGLHAPRDAVEARRQDLDYLDRLTEVDRSFTPEAAARFHERVAGLRARAGELTRGQFFLGVAGAVALADNAHTSVDAKAWRDQIDGSPLRLRWFEEGLHIVRAAAPHEALRGARVLALDGVEPEVLVREAARHFGGPPERARLASLALMESPEALNALLPQAARDRLVVRAAMRDGVERTIEVPAIPAGRNPDMQWIAARDPAIEPPPSERGSNRTSHAQRLADDVLYLHLWRIGDDPDRTLQGAIRAALGPGSDPPWRRILLDLRSNGGGDVPLVHGAIRALPERLARDGKLVILQDHSTFSAAIIVAALGKHFAGTRAVIVGEKPGDRLAFWAEGNDLRLPNSRIRITASSGHHDWARGCRELRCYWPNFFYSVGVGSVDPDIVVRRRFDDYLKGVDTVLLRALQV